MAHRALYYDPTPTASHVSTSWLRKRMISCSVCFRDDCSLVNVFLVIDGGEWISKNLHRCMLKTKQKLDRERVWVLYSKNRNEILARAECDDG
jgi:hypothetical protein